MTMSAPDSWADLAIGQVVGLLALKRHLVYKNSKFYITYGVGDRAHTSLRVAPSSPDSFQFPHYVM